VLEVVEIRKRFDAVEALAGCSFSVERGRMLGFLGPNGAGKTTAMRTVFGLVPPDAGEVHWDGRPIGVAERLRFGYMPEERGLYPRMRVGEQLVYFGRLHGMAPKTARAAASRWLARLGLEGRGGAKVEELSHGNQQRAQLAAALVHEPELLVLDEPSRVSTRWRCIPSPKSFAERQPAAPPSSSPATSSSSWRTSAGRSRSSTTDASSQPATWTR
jgi:ABC-2 type transport system ATP-binding protein